MKKSVLDTGFAAGPVAGEGEHKFISTVDTHVILPLRDDKGEIQYKSDSRGNNRVPIYKTYRFKHVPKHVSGQDGERQFSHQECWVFIASKKVHGRDYEEILEQLTERSKNPSNCLFSEDDFFRMSNPQAYRMMKREKDLTATIEDKDKKIKDLEQKLGLTKKQDK